MKRAWEQEPGKTSRYRFLDPITGDQYPVETFTADGRGQWDIPGTPVMHDFVLVIYE